MCSHHEVIFDCIIPIGLFYDKNRIFYGFVFIPTPTFTYGNCRNSIVYHIHNLPVEFFGKRVVIANHLIAFG